MVINPFESFHAPGAQKNSSASCAAVKISYMIAILLLNADNMEPAIDVNRLSCHSARKVGYKEHRSF